MKKLLALLLAAVMVVGLTACGGNTPQTTPAPATTTTAAKPAETTTQAPAPAETTTQAPAPAETTTQAPAPAETTTQAPAPETTEAPKPETPEIPDPIENPEFEVLKAASLEWDKDYTSLYEHCGKEVMIADVIEDPETGFAYIEVDGELHELGLDFLTMAMVYNIDPEGSEYETSDDVYAAWWRMYITRWNYLLPEVPLYTNEYYDVYRAQIKGVEDHPTNPYWNVARALVDWNSEKADKDIIIGNSTELSGQLRWPTFGKSSAGASDNDVNALISGYATVTNTKEGGYVWNDIVVKDHDEVVNDDGSKTFTITIKEGLTFSDGSPITAENYVVMSLMQLTPVQSNASGRELEGKTILGGPDYHKYTGPGSAEGSKTLAGMRLLDEYTFAVTVPAAYIPYFYDVTYASFSPQPVEMWLGEGVEIMDDGEGCYLSDSFYDKDGDNYKQAANIKFYATDTSKDNWTKYPFSGPYVVDSYDLTDNTAVLKINPEFKGIYDGGKPSIEKVIYRRVVSSTQLEELKNGGIDVIAGITGGKETDEALAHVRSNPNDFVYTHYSRAGYGKLGMRCDYGPVMFHEVRQAIAYCMNRAQFAKDFTGGYGGVVDGPYYSGSWMYEAATEQGMMLDSYATSSDSAIEVLEDNGWIYDKDGNEYTSGVRYKKIPAELAEADERIINYKSMDSAYTTTKVGEDYYMPLVINWFGTLDNEFTDLLQTGFRENANIEASGIKVYNQLGEFNPMRDELAQRPIYGYYSGSPMYCAFNFATSFATAVYDYSFNMTINPDEFDSYSSYFIKDYADIYWLND